MDQAFAWPGLGHVECLHLCRDLARVIVDAGLVLLRDINHFHCCSMSLRELRGPKLDYGSMRLLYREYLMNLRGIGLKERR